MSKTLFLVLRNSNPLAVTAYRKRADQEVEDLKAADAGLQAAYGQMVKFLASYDANHPYPRRVLEPVSLWPSEIGCLTDEEVEAARAADAAVQARNDEKEERHREDVNRWIADRMAAADEFLASIGYPGRREEFMSANVYMRKRMDYLITEVRFLD